MAVSNVRKRFIIGSMTDHLRQKSIESKVLFTKGHNDDFFYLQILSLMNNRVESIHKKQNM